MDWIDNCLKSLYNKSKTNVGLTTKGMKLKTVASATHGHHIIIMQKMREHSSSHSMPD